jgi:hypothetical protein
MFYCVLVLALTKAIRTCCMTVQCPLLRRPLLEAERFEYSTVEELWAETSSGTTKDKSKLWHTIGVICSYTHRRATQGTDEMVSYSMHVNIFRQCIHCC